MSKRYLKKEKWVNNKLEALKKSSSLTLTYANDVIKLTDLSRTRHFYPNEW